MIAVSDTSPVSNLLQIGEIDLLRKLFSRIIVPKAVFDEVCRIVAHKVALSELDWVEVVPLSDHRLRDRLISELDEGEAEAIALAVQLGADYVLIDERKAREIAAFRGLKTTGLLGVLIKAKKGRTYILDSRVYRPAGDRR